MIMTIIFIFFNFGIGSLTFLMEKGVISGLGKQVSAGMQFGIWRERFVPKKPSKKRTVAVKNKCKGNVGDLFNMKFGNGNRLRFILI